MNIPRWLGRFPPFALALGLGCATPVPERLTERERADAYALARVVFDDAVLRKPGSAENSSLSAALAPLLLEEATRDASGATFSSATLEIVYARERTVEFQGRSHSQCEYWWAQSDNPERVADGFRMTLNSNGAPALWECHSGSNGVRRLFVAASLEQAAQRRYGSPLAGRRYSIERSVLEQPTVVVAGVVEDGPIPMGPIVYLTAGSRHIATLLCRCTPAQARNVTATDTYQLVTLTQGDSAPTQPQAQVRWLSDIELANALRLPQHF